MTGQPTDELLRMMAEAECGYCGKATADHPEPCMPEPLGPSSDFGWQACHGCEVLCDCWTEEDHSIDCPGRCVRIFCLPHGRRPGIPDKGRR